MGDGMSGEVCEGVCCEADGGVGPVKDLLERAVATFVQAALGYLVDSAAFDNPAVWRTAMFAGVAAVLKWVLKEARAWRQIRGVDGA